MKTLEEITYDAGRHALADQEALVAGIRQRTGTLVAAHALVASFLGGDVLRGDRLQTWGWLAIVALALGLAVAAALLSPWRLKFAFDAKDLHMSLHADADLEAEAGTLGWLAAAGYGYQDLRSENARRVALMSRMSGGLALLLIAQTLSWLAQVGVT